MKKIISVALSLLFLLSLCSCSAENSVQKKEMYKKDFIDLFDTASSITAADASQQSFNEHFEAVYAELEEYSRLFDIYNSYGDLVNLKYINEILCIHIRRITTCNETISNCCNRKNIK